MLVTVKTVSDALDAAVTVRLDAYAVAIANTIPLGRDTAKIVPFTGCPRTNKHPKFGRKKPPRIAAKRLT